jgi:hypothetical protein
MRRRIDPEARQALRALGFGLLARDPELRIAGAGSSLAGAAAVLVGARACARLR